MLGTIVQDRENRRYEYLGSAPFEPGSGYDQMLVLKETLKEFLIRTPGFEDVTIGHMNDVFGPEIVIGSGKYQGSDIAVILEEAGTQDKGGRMRISVVEDRRYSPKTLLGAGMRKLGFDWRGTLMKESDFENLVGYIEGGHPVYKELVS